jgi:hypothetical protein
MSLNLSSHQGLGKDALHTKFNFSDSDESNGYLLDYLSPTCLNKHLPLLI